MQMQPKSLSLANLVRALRLPFVTASVLPFICGSLLAKGRLNYLSLGLGLIAAACLHLSANLINDYADSKSGNDWQDLRFWKFFGGSKLIQEKVFSERFYLNLALFFAFVSFLSVAACVLILKNMSIFLFYALILVLGWSYSLKPLQLSYRAWGELVIFTLFGPALVMGGYFIQTQVFPELRSFILSLPFGFFTAAILFANEVPDYPHDKNSFKKNLVEVVGLPRAYIVYYFLMFSAFLAIVISVYSGILGKIALLVLLFIPVVLKAGDILKRQYAIKEALVVSSKVTICLQAAAGGVIILGMLL